jgi:hypothetical protein
MNTWQWSRRFFFFLFHFKIPSWSLAWALFGVFCFLLLTLWLEYSGVMYMGWVHPVTDDYTNERINRIVLSKWLLGHGRKCPVLNIIHRYQINSANQAQILQQYSLFSRWLTLGSQVRYAARRHNRNYLSLQVSIACQTSYYIIESLLKIDPKPRQGRTYVVKVHERNSGNGRLKSRPTLQPSTSWTNQGTSQGSCLSRGQPSRRRIRFASGKSPTPVRVSCTFVFVFLGCRSGRKPEDITPRGNGTL